MGIKSPAFTAVVGASSMPSSGQMISTGEATAVARIVIEGRNMDRISAMDAM